MLMGMSFLLSRELLLNLVKNVPVYNYVITSDIFCIMFQSLLHLAIHISCMRMVILLRGVGWITQFMPQLITFLCVE